jgi:hypothetical protein
MQVELGDQLSQAGGSRGSASSLHAALSTLLGGRSALAGAALPPLTEPALLAFTLAATLAELARAALAPLPALGACWVGRAGV